MKDCESDNDRSPFCRPGRPPSVARVRQASTATVPSDHAYAANRSRRLRYVSPPAPRIPHINPAIEKTLTQRLNQCNKENQKLKNLLLVNLDLVQQQSDRILSKDKVLADLKKENATLHLRVQRNNWQEELAPAPSVRPPYQEPPPLVPVQALPAVQPPAPMQVSHQSQLPVIPSSVQAEGNYPNFIISEPSSDPPIIEDFKEEEAEVLHLPDVNIDEQQENTSNGLAFDKEVQEYLNTPEIDSLLKVCEETDLNKTTELLFTENQEVILGDFDIPCETTEDSDVALQQNTTLSDLLDTPGVNHDDQLKVINPEGNSNPMNDDNVIAANSGKSKLSHVTSAQSMSSLASVTSPRETDTSSRDSATSPRETATLSRDSTMSFQQSATSSPREPMKSRLLSKSSLDTYTSPRESSMTLRQLSSSSQQSTKPSQDQATLQNSASSVRSLSSRSMPQRANMQSRHRRPIAKLSEDVGPPARKSETVTSYTQFYKSRKAYRLPRSATVTSAEETNTTPSLEMIDDARIMYTGSLSDRFKLIDTTPTGEDPYQLGEDDTREQSPILKFHHAKPKDYTSHANVYHSSLYSHDKTKKVKRDPYQTSDQYQVLKNGEGSADEQAANQQVVVSSPPALTDLPTSTIDLKLPFHTSISDFSYGESQIIPSRNIFDDECSLSPMAPCSPSDYLLHPMPEEKPVDTHPVTTSTGYSLPQQLSEGATVVKAKSSGAASKRRRSHTSSHVRHSSVDRAEGGGKWAAYVQDHEVSPTAATTDHRKCKKSKRSRNSRRKEKSTASPESATSSMRSYSPISSPHFYTTLGSANSSWTISPKRLDAASHSRQQIKQLVEVPRWRDITLGACKSPITSWCGSEEIEEDLSDTVFEMRHRKMELAEKRQKRWDRQRMREQLLVERLRLRQPDAPWYRRASAREPQEPRSFLREPLHNIQYIELLGHNQPLPVSAFGDNIPRIPQCDFYLPWIRSSKPKRKRTKKLKYELSLENEGHQKYEVINNE